MFTPHHRSAAALGVAGAALLRPVPRRPAVRRRAPTAGRRTRPSTAAADAALAAKVPGRHQGGRRDQGRHRLDVRPGGVPRHRRQDGDRLRRRAVQRGRREARPEGRVRVGAVRRDPARCRLRQVRDRRLVVHHQRRAQEAASTWSATSRPAPSGRPRRATRPGSTLDNACGKKIAVQTGTVQVDDITARSKKCTDAGKPAITIDQYQAPERRHRRGGQRQGRRHAGRLAGRRVRGEADQRPAGAARRDLRVGPVRLRGEEGPAAFAEVVKEAVAGAHRRRHRTRRSLDEVGRRRRRDHRPRGQPAADHVRRDGHTERARPEPIQAVPVRHPGAGSPSRCSAVLAAMFVHLLVTNKAFNWSFMVDEMFRPPIMEGAARHPRVDRSCAMLIGVVLGIVIAIMRLSDNPILRASPGSTPGSSGRCPGWCWPSSSATWASCGRGSSSGCPSTGRSARSSASTTSRRGCSASARVDILDRVRRRHARRSASPRPPTWPRSSGPASSRWTRGRPRRPQALGLSRTQILRRIVLPQAMRVIIPPTGNETIAMLKDTSLVAFVPVSTELFFQLKAVGKPDLPGLPDVRRGVPVVPAADQRPAGRAVLPGAALRPGRTADRRGPGAGCAGSRRRPAAAARRGGGR